MKTSKLIAGLLAGAIMVSATAPAYATRVLPKAHPIGAGTSFPWPVALLICGASGPIFTTLMLKRELTHREAVLSMLFCFPPFLYGAILKEQDRARKSRKR